MRIVGLAVPSKPNLSIILSHLGDDMAKAGRKHLPSAYATGKGYAAAKSGVSLTGRAEDANRAYKSIAKNEVFIGEFLSRLESDISAIDPLDFLDVDQFLAEIDRVFDVYANRIDAWTNYAEQSYLDGFMAGAEEASDSLAQEWGVTSEEVGMFWRTAEDELVCDICAALDGEWFPASEMDIGTEAHIGCLIPGQVVETIKGPVPIEDVSPSGDAVLTHTGYYRKVRGASKRRYKGKVYQLTYQGKTVTVTPEHPVLTQRGWVQARELTSSDTLVTKDSLPGCHLPLE